VRWPCCILQLRRKKDRTPKISFYMNIRYIKQRLIMKHLHFVAVIVILLLVILTVTTGCVHRAATTPSPTSTTKINMNKSISSKSANGLILSLSLDSTTYQPGQNITIVVDEKNTLSKTNKVATSDNWVYDHFRGDPCDSISPFGAAIFRGDYTVSNFSTAAPLTIYDPLATLMCPAYPRVISYEFQPSSDTANIIADSKYDQGFNSWHLNYEVIIRRYWPDIKSGNYSTIFEPGVYTVVAGDEWGALVVLHFTVTQ